MVVKNVLHMNAGDGETSYANNSGLQKYVMSKTLPVLNGTLKDMYNNHTGFAKSFKMVDLGCSSGPNTFLATSHIINTIEELCRENNINDLPEFEVFLNDLPGNDFNNLFKLLPNLLNDRDDGKQRGNYYIYGLPGSFYSRLFPSNCLHFTYSSYSLHWLSQVPRGLENNNKKYIYMAMTSPREVYEAYAKQYQRDFCKFLSLRAEEIKSGGHMVLTIVGRSVEDPSTKDDFPVFTLLAKTLEDMVTEEVGKMDDLYSFNMPFYAPCTQEVETAVQAEGSFTLDKIQCFRVPLHLSENNSSDVDDDEQEDPLIFDRYKRGKIVADKFIRAFMEPMLASHFGSSIIDDLFLRYAHKLAEYLRTGKLDNFNIVVSLGRR